MLSNFLGMSVALLLLGASQPLLAAKPSPGCGKAPKIITPAAGSSPGLSITSGGVKRQYFVKLPANYDNTHPYRLIFAMHPVGGSGEQTSRGTGGYYNLPNLINDTIGAIYVAPTGTSGPLGVGWWNNGGSDVTFVKDLINEIENDVCIDQNLRFSTGFSHGGAMSFILACALGKELRAVAVLSGSPQISGQCPGGTEPVAWYSQHGTRDQVLPIAGGRQMRDRFLKNNGCAAKEAKEPARGEKHIKTVYECAKEYPTTFVAFDGDHTPSPRDPGATSTFSDKYTWEFFSQFT
ncbi:carbohydrate esterase family 1 protein [Canariomyces notabilis]|uniref:Feruloyl esterase C n=1 Tax=Canariomyces notabilis TaxID=2074819 RepID=A0AAN6QCF1_9PEZI|nr:carbohydrate esterase family 1 protein [Canariomyces arenarius]